MPKGMEFLYNLAKGASPLMGLPGQAAFNTFAGKKEGDDGVMFPLGLNLLKGVLPYGLLGNALMGSLNPPKESVDNPMDNPEEWFQKMMEKHTKKKNITAPLQEDFSGAQNPLPSIETPSLLKQLANGSGGM